MPRYILSVNGMEFKNSLMDQVLQQLGIDRIFSAPYHPQSNGKLEEQNICIWQHLGSNRSDMQLQHLTTISSIPVHKIYQHLLNSTMHVVPFNTESPGNTASLWTLFRHLGIYASAIGLLIPVGIGLFCCYFFWC